MPPVPHLRPLFVALAIVALGIVVGALLPTSPVLIPLCYGLAIAMWLLSLFLLFRASWGPLLLCLALFVVAVARTVESVHPAPGDIAEWKGPSPVWVRGTVISDPEEKAHGSVALTLAVHAAGNYRQMNPARGQIRVILNGLPPVTRPAPGDEIQVRGIVEEAPPQTNPEGFDYRAYLRRRGIFSTLQGKHATDFQAVGVGEYPLVQRWAARLREYMLSVTERYMQPADAALMNGLLLSVRTRVPVEWEEAFARTGSIHILSVSGLHLTTLALFLGWLFGLFSAPRPLVSALSIGLLWLFALASGASPAAVRSAIMATFLLLAPLVHRRSEPLHSLAAAGVTILLVEPGALYDVGFQLSFATTATLLLWGPSLIRLLLPWEPGMNVLQRVATFLLGAILIGLVAEAGSGPLAAYHFHQWTLVGPLANIPIEILTNFLLIGGLAALGLSWLPGFIIGPIWWIIGLGVELLRWLALAFSALPGAAFSVVAPPLPLLLIYYALLGGGGFVIRRIALRKVLFRPGPVAMASDLPDPLPADTRLP